MKRLSIQTLLEGQEDRRKSRQGKNHEIVRNKAVKRKEMKYKNAPKGQIIKLRSQRTEEVSDLKIYQLHSKIVRIHKQLCK